MKTRLRKWLVDPVETVAGCLGAVLVVTAAAASVGVVMGAFIRAIRFIGGF